MRRVCREGRHRAPVDDEKERDVKRVVADSTGLVELIAHEILFNPRFTLASVPRITYCLGCMILGSGIMALLGRWA